MSSSFSWRISKYILQAVLPYFVFIWLLLSVILFVQQAGRYTDIFFSANIPTGLLWQLTFALLPNVVAFTCPMAVLIGSIIGISRMRGDYELVALRSAGVGNLQVTIPILLLGISLSFFTFFINLKGIPFAAQIVRKVAVQAAIYKPESPIEPGVFNTEINGYTIYVKDGDFESGTWKNIFIYNEDQNAQISRLITSKKGRLDSNSEKSELVLEQAVISTIPITGAKEKFISENVGQVRVSIKTKRSELVEKLTKGEQLPDELGLTELSKFIETKEGKERIEAQILLLRRIVLSITPLIFALLGTSLVLRFNRGGRGFGIFLALISLVGYYLLALLGEQLARTQFISAFTGSILPILISSLLIAWFYLSNRLFLKKNIGNYGIGKFINNNYKLELSKIFKTRSTFSFNNGILDLDIILSLLKYLFLTLGFLGSIYIIFTAFELWKFAGIIENGTYLLFKYLFYLIPFIYIQLAPSALMIATLTAYVIKSRQNEIVTWISAGQSVYRLLFPCFALMILIGVLNFGLQELILPRSNEIQDELRSQIRNKGIAVKKEGKLWVASENRIYSFETEQGSFTKKQSMKNLTVYEFSNEDTKLLKVYKVPKAVWETEKIIFDGETDVLDLQNGSTHFSKSLNGELREISNPFNDLYKKPNHLNISAVKQQIENTESSLEKRNYQVALEKKYTTLILPFIITLFTAPFALSLSRKGKVMTVGYAVGIWLLFMGITNTFEQFGLSGFIPPTIAVWAPLLLFSMLGIYLLSKIKT
ncbi:MAG TPA: LptF/LptG family permease [Pyrinomonadaceae bacterium]|nr:LptF/LptG family permease [Pyrinomonadaceae bacterium]